MLTIRNQQIDILGEARRRDFEQRLIAHVTRELESRQRPPIAASELRDMVSLGVSEAAQYGLTTEKQVAGFVETTYIYLGAVAKGRLPKSALAILCTYGLKPEIKLEKYREWAAARVRRTGYAVQ